MEARKVLDTWVAAVRASDTDAVVEMYAEGSILLPTFSPHRIVSVADLRGYFDALFTREELQVELHEASLRFLPMSGTAYAIVGIYSFSFVVDDDRLTFPSRFTFVIDTANDAPIQHHHSSQVPRTLS
jgi:hypothetical protein